MSKMLKKSNLDERPATRMLVAISLCATMVAVGCTTDRTLGNGDPVVTPGLRTSPTGGTSYGTESESVPPPMMSSYSGASALPAVRPRVSREEAALLLAEMQPRVRVLGVVAPGSSGRPYVSGGTPPSMMIPGRSTVNSSIYSGPNSVVTSGAGEAIGGTADAGAVFVDTATVDAANVVTTGVGLGATVVAPTVTNGATVVTNPSAAVVAPSTAVSETATANSLVAPPAFASVRTLSPTAAAVVNPPASVSGSPAIASVSSQRTAGTTQAATTQSVATPSTASASVANPVRVVTTNGRVTVTNVNGREQ